MVWVSVVDSDLRNIIKTFAITDKKSISSTRQIFSNGNISEISFHCRGNDNQV